MVQNVKDKIAERGINVGVIVQSLLLAATIGFGTKIVNSVDTLTLEVSKLVTVTQLNKSEINHNSQRIDHVEQDIIDIEIALQRLGQ